MAILKLHDFLYFCSDDTSKKLESNQVQGAFNSPNEIACLVGNYIMYFYIVSRMFFIGWILVLAHSLVIFNCRYTDERCH
jgi:hypothetical protein